MRIAMSTVPRAVLLLFLGAAPAVAQGTPSSTLRTDVEFARRAWREVHGYLVQSATMAPDSIFPFTPAPEVRSFAETLDHVAASELGYCQMALGERPGAGGAGTGARTKSELLAALRAAADMCDRAYAQSDDESARPAYGGGRATRLHVLLENAMHDKEHYGNIVTYLRLKGMVPPSSQPTSP
jgi:uncharacterized damage-inducible protein DinB